MCSTHRKRITSQSIPKRSKQGDDGCLDGEEATDKDSSEADKAIKKALEEEEQEIGQEEAEEALEKA